MNNSIHADLIYFLKQCANTILGSSSDLVIRNGAKKLSLRLDDAGYRDFSASDLPVLGQLDEVIESPFLFNFRQIASNLKWRPSPRADFDAQVMALCSLNEMLKLGDVVAGLSFMTPEQIYPEHSHAPQEIYLILSGTASWLYGGNNEYQQLKPGDVIYNHPRDIHGMRTQGEPLLALYLLWGDKTEGYNY